MRIKNFDKAVEELQTHLVSYLEEQGIDTKKNFKCINPIHSDSSPSCSVIPGGIRIYCHGCSGTYDIFDCVRILENKPGHGFGFITEIVQYLADKYKVNLEMGEISEEKVYEIMTYRAYRDAANYISSNELSKLCKIEVERRQWSKETLKETFTGTVVSYKHFIDHMMIYKGYDETFLQESDLNRSDIFNANCLIFTICDEYGSPVGFAARNLLFNKEDPSTGAKYINQRTTGTKANIYQKGKRLYGFNLIKDVEGPIYIFEGQGDVLTAREHGLLNCCAIGSTALTTDHILLLKEFNKYNIILTLDSDKPGQDKTEKLLDTRFAGHKDMRVSIVLIPGGMDPDDYIRTNGIDAFKELAKWSAFEWRLDRFENKTDPGEISRAMIPFIVNEPSYISQEEMAKALSNATGYSFKAIQSEVNRLQNVQEERKASERKVIVERALKDVIESPLDAETILTETKNKLFAISKKYDEDTMSEETFLREIEEQKAFEENKDGKFSGFILGSHLSIFQDKMNGQWNKDVLCIFAGKANAGKTAMMCKIGYSIASQEENNAVVIYHTIDDSREQLLPRLVCIAQQNQDLTINQVRSPQYWTIQKGDSIKTNRKEAYSKIESLAKQGRLIVKDANHGTSIAYMENLIAYFQEKYPKRQVVYILDNFHKLSDYADQKEERVRFKKLSNTMKDMATRYHIPILTTCEYNKVAFGTRPDNNSISETRALEYDSNLIVHLYNELHERGYRNVDEDLIHHQDNISEPLPKIEMIFGKNKITNFKSSLWFKFYPASSDFIECEAPIIKNPCSTCKNGNIYKNEKGVFLCTNKGCGVNPKNVVKES